MGTVNVTDESFEQDVLKSDKPVLVDFWATYCGPCKAMAPSLEQIADELAGQVTIAKIEIMDNPETPTVHNVKGVPTLMLFKDGKMASMKVGPMHKSKIVEWLVEQGAAVAPAA